MIGGNSNALKAGINALGTKANSLARDVYNALSDPEFYKRDLPRHANQAAGGLVSGALGAPVDLATVFLRPFGVTSEQVGGTDWIGRKLGFDPQSPAFFAGSFGPTPDATDALRIASKIDPMSLIGLAGMTAFHGSPHKFDAFDIKKIGTGEGAQAYGHGLYFAENPEVAGSYKTVGNARVARYEQRLTPNGEFAADLIEQGHSDTDILDMFAKSGRSDFDEAMRAIDEAKSAGFSKGALYEVDIPDEAIEKMLDWDKPLSEQPESVLVALDPVRLGLKRADYKNVSGWVDSEGRLIGPAVKIDGPPESRTFSDEWLADWWKDRMIKSKDGGELYKRLGNNEAASRALNQAGIPGIRYLDQGSRATGKGTRNFVVFDDSLVKIVDRK